MKRSNPGIPPSRRPGKSGDWQEKLRKATDMVIAMVHHFDGPDVEVIREKVIRNAREALGPKPSREMFREDAVDLGDGNGPQKVVSTSGVFRMVLDDASLIYRDEISAETIMDVIQKRLEYILGVTWAAKHATLQEIANLDDVWRGLRPVEEDQILIPGGDAAYSAAERIYAIIAGVDPSDFDRDAAREFWNTYGPKSDEVLLDPAFLRGFIHGVGEIEGE